MCLVEGSITYKENLPDDILNQEAWFKIFVCPFAPGDKGLYPLFKGAKKEYPMGEWVHHEDYKGNDDEISVDYEPGFHAFRSYSKENLIYFPLTRPMVLAEVSVRDIICYGSEMFLKDETKRIGLFDVGVFKEIKIDKIITVKSSVSNYLV